MDPLSKIDARNIDRVDRIGGYVLRYGLVAILLFFGAFKFTAVEAQGIEPLVRNSPFMSWLYALTSVRGVSNIIGIAEILVAGALLARPWSPRVTAVGSFGGVLTFLTTLSFLVTTPGIWVSVPGFPLPVPNELGSFIVKDVFLLGASLWSAAEALRAVRAGPVPAVGIHASTPVQSVN